MPHDDLTGSAGRSDDDAVRPDHPEPVDRPVPEARPGSGTRAASAEHRTSGDLAAPGGAPVVPPTLGLDQNPLASGFRDGPRRHPASWGTLVLEVVPFLALVAVVLFFATR